MSSVDRSMSLWGSEPYGNARRQLQKRSEDNGCSHKRAQGWPPKATGICVSWCLAYEAGNSAGVLLSLWPGEDCRQWPLRHLLYASAAGRAPLRRPPGTGFGAGRPHLPGLRRFRTRQAIDRGPSPPAGTIAAGSDDLALSGLPCPDPSHPGGAVGDARSSARAVAGASPARPRADGSRLPLESG